ncbi:hypothetical protein [Amycolatopsis sp. CA-128772]|uniref:hypothetical protein n=1 Tax=Amycolatopsis sp. CA-128772 TaxID=2073159 RepID=UPI0011AFF19D|nr:hypothetical protein [Amycolatopsis sp. CA-128772]
MDPADALTSADTPDADQSCSLVAALLADHFAANERAASADTARRGRLAWDANREQWSTRARCALLRRNGGQA